MPFLSLLLLPDLFSLPSFHNFCFLSSSSLPALSFLFLVRLFLSLLALLFSFARSLSFFFSLSPSGFHSLSLSLYLFALFLFLVPYSSISLLVSFSLSLSLSLSLPFALSYFSNPLGIILVCSLSLFYLRYFLFLTQCCSLFPLGILLVLSLSFCLRLARILSPVGSLHGVRFLGVCVCVY